MPDDEALKAIIRSEYETTPISVRALTQRYGLKSKTTIVRWIAREGWTRDQSLNLADIVVSAATEPRPDDTPKPKTRPRRKAQAPPPEPDPAPEDQPPDAGGEASEDEKKAHARKRVVSVHLFEGGEGEEELASDDAGLAMALRELQVKAVRKQLVMAQRIARVGGALLDTIEAVLVAEGEDYERALGRLKALNQFESLSAVGKTCIVLLEGGALMERRALGLEVATRFGFIPNRANLADPAIAAVPAEVKTVLDGLSEATLLELRRVTVEVQRLQSGPGSGVTIDGVADSAPETKSGDQK
jgi:hypothetical protein